MADTFSSATLGLGVDTKQFNKELNNASVSVDAALSRMKLSADSFSDKWGDMTRGIKDTKRIVSGILVSQGFYALSNALVTTGGAALEFSKNMETAAVSLEYFVKGADKAAKAQAYLRTMNEFAAKTPFSTETALSLSKYMQAVGVSMGTTKSFLKVITDTASATGATQENLQRIVFGLGQMMTKGRLANEEIRQLANANIPIYEILQEQLGLTGKQISNIGKEWVSADRAVVAILNGLEQRYAGASDRISNTVTGMVDTIKDDAKIIAQAAGDGIYDNLKGTMTSLRDTLDRYREIVTEKGSMGLFDQILRDMDASGEVGSLILALIGNTRQLGEAFRELYINGKPVVDLLGKTLYSSLTVLEITMTGFTQFVNGAIKALGGLGITSQTTAEIISSLIITYKASKWMAFLGQGAISAAYGMYQTISSATAMLPAFARANVGTKILTSGLIGLITYGLAAVGVFKMLNNSFAGLSSKTTGDNLFPDDYSEAFKKYEQEQEEYNKKIAAYSEAYNAPFSEITDGADAATSGLEDVAKTSKKTAKSVKNDWTAAFDEVYSIPDQSGSDDIAALKDLGALLQSPSFKFPDINVKGSELKSPTIPWKDIFKGGLLDTDVMNGDWWKSMLPGIILGAAGVLGDNIAKAQAKKNAAKGTSTGATSESSPFQSGKDATTVLGDLTKEFTKVEKGVAEVGAQIKGKKFATEAEQQGLYRLLEERLAAANKLLDKINRQAVIAGKFDSHLESAVLKEFNNLSEVKKIADNVSRLSTLADQAKQTGLLGDTARKELAEIKTAIQKQYANYVGRNGASTAELDSLLEGIVDTKGLQGRVDTLISSVADMKKTLEQSKYKAIDIESSIKDTVKLGNSVLMELKSIGADTTAVNGSLTTLHSIDKLLKMQLDLVDDLDKLVKFKEVLSSADSRGLTGVQKSAVVDSIESLSKSVQNLNKSIDAQTALISHGDTAEATMYRVQQAIIDSNNRFNGVAGGLLDRYLSATLRPMKALEIYTKRIMLDNAEGHTVLKTGAKQAVDMIAKLNKPFESSLKSFFDNLRQSYEEIMQTKSVPANFSSDIQGKLIAAVKEMGIAIGADAETVEKYLSELTDKLSDIDGHVKELDYLAKQRKQSHKESREQTTDVSARTVMDVIEDRLGVVEETAKTIMEFNKEVKSIQKFVETKYPNEVAKLQSEINEQFSLSRQMLAEKFSQLSGLQKLANSSMYKIAAHSEELKNLALLADKLEVLNKQVVGKGIRRGWAFPEESASAPWANAIQAGYIDAAIVKAGVFDPGRLALSGGDVAGMFGQSGYGVTVNSATISNISEAAKALYGLPKSLDTIASLMNKTFGAVAEIPILVATAQELKAKGYRLTLGDTFFDEYRRLQAQLDGLLWRGSTFSATIDAKALASFNSKIKPLLEKTAKFSEGIYRIGAAGFKELVRKTDDIAWQLAQQATIMGKNNAWLAVLDTKGAGIAGPNYAEAYRFDPTVAHDIEKISKIAQQQAAAQYWSRLDAIRENLYIINATIPKWAQEVVKQLGEDFAKWQKVLSEAILKTGNIDSLVNPINQLGETIGKLTEVRYDSSVYKAPTVGGPQITSILDRIESQLKNNSTAIQEIGRVRLQDLIERLEKAAYNGASSVEQRIIELGATSTGITARVKLTGEEIVDKILPAIKEFQTSFETRATSLTIQLGDLVKQMNNAAADNLKLTDVLRTTLEGKDYTVKDLAFQIMSTDKQLNGGSNVSTQIQSMLSGNAAMPVTNPYSFADLGTALAAAAGNLEKLMGTDDQLKLGNSVYIVKSAADLAKEFSATKWNNFTAAAGDFSSNSGVYQTLNSLFGGKFNYGKYAAYTGNASAAEAGATPSQTGVYANVGKTTWSASSEQLATLGKALGYAGIVLSLGGMAKSSADTQKLFTDSVLPTIGESDQEAAKKRAGKMGLSGFDSGVLAGTTADAFLSEYKNMTAQERLFWGSIMSQRKSTFNMAGATDFDRLKSVIDNGQDIFGTPNPGAEKLGSKEMLQKAMQDGIDNSELARLTDYIVTSGDTSSDIAKAFYKKYGAYVDEVVKPAYGMDENWRTAVNAIIEGAKDNKQINSILSRLGGNITSADDVSLRFKGVFDELIKQLQDNTEAKILPLLDAQKVYNTDTSNPIEGNYSRILSGIDLSGLSNEVQTEIGNALGMSLTNLPDNLTRLNIDAKKIEDNIIGWTERLPSTISLDGSTISTQDAKILAQAGIQINGDGTVTFMKAMNENTTGTERNTSLTIQDVSNSVINKLAESGLSFDFSEGANNLELDVSKLSSRMQSALFSLDTDLSGQVSDDMNEALSGLGTVLDSGYLQITNTAVLNGNMTISEYIRGMGSKADELSPELRKSLENIDNVIAQGGAATRDTVAQWANGITMPSPIDESALTDEIKTAFSSIGVTFETQGDEFMMVVNRVGNNLSDGMTLIPQKTWDKLNTDIKTALQTLGVSMVTEAGYVKVDVSDAMCKIVKPEDITPAMQTAMSELGLTFKTEGNKLKLASAETGEEIASGMFSLPTAVYEKLSPATITALEALHVGIVTKGSETMLNFKNVMDGGVADVISLFANRPDLWDKIPKVVVDKLAEAGIAVKNGMIEINTEEINGLVNVDNQWYGYWSTIPDDVITAMDAAKLETSNGLMRIEQITESTKIPADVNTYIRKPFDQLPQAIKDRLTGGDESVAKSLRGSEVLITGATKDAFVGAVQAVHNSFSDMNSEANSGAKQLADTIANALADVQKLSNIKVGDSWIKNKEGEVTFDGKPGNYTVRYGGNKYSGITAQTEHEAVKMVERLTGIDIPGYAVGGIASGLSLVGEEGKELAILPDGSLRIVGRNSGELLDLPEGTRIVNNADTKDILKYTNGLAGVSSVKKLAEGNTEVKVGATATETFEKQITTSLTAILDTLKVSGEAGVKTAAESTETTAEALHNVVKTIIEELTGNSRNTDTKVDSASSSITTAITNLSGTITSSIKEATSEISSAISSIHFESPSLSSYSRELTSSTTDIIGQAKKDWAEANEKYLAAQKSEDAESMKRAQSAMDAAHATAEAERAKSGYSGGDDGSQFISLSSLAKAVSDGVSDGITIATQETGQKTTISTVKGSARGSLVTKDALYRAGELGLNEAIIPLENRQVLNKVGAAIAESTPSTTVTAAVTVLADSSIAKVLTGFRDIISPAIESAKETNAVAIRNAVGVLTETTSLKNTELKDTMQATKDGLTTSISSAADAIKEAIGNINFPSSSLGSSSLLGSVTSTVKSSAEIIADAKKAYANATTDAERNLAHATAEAERAKLGYSGGEDGSEYNKIKGSARGSLITKDALYRAGEFGLNEAIIPLENPSVMSKLGSAIYNSMPTEFNQMLKAAVGIKNAGIAVPQMMPVAAQQQPVDTATIVSSVTQAVLESVLPAMTYTSQETPTPIYVGTLIADDAGLKTLERKLYVIRQSEQTRR